MYQLQEARRMLTLVFAGCWDFSDAGLCTRVCPYVPACVCTCVYVCAPLCMYACACVCLYACTCVFVPYFFK